MRTYLFEKHRLSLENSSFVCTETFHTRTELRSGSLIAVDLIKMFCYCSISQLRPISPTICSSRGVMIKNIFTGGLSQT